VNCRIPRTIESLNASCARGHSAEGTPAWASRKTRSHPLIGERDAACGPSSRKGRWAEDMAAGVSCRTQRVVGDLALLPQCIRRVADVMASKDPMNGAHDAPTATPGQAGLPAEFKHINKRRRRNLQGFP
jgi:hypothetical protein